MITIEPDFSRVYEGLDKISSRGRILGPVLKPLREELRADIADHFEEGAGPGGGRWPSWASSTQQRFFAQRANTSQADARKILAGKKVAVRYKNVTRGGQLKAGAARKMTRILGRLPRAGRYKIGPTYVEYRNTIPWSDAQNKGGLVGHGAVLPERRFAYASGRLEAIARNLFIEHLLADW